MNIFVAENSYPWQKCSICNKIIKNRRILYQHVKRCKESWVPPEFMCGYCPYQTGLKSKLLRHVNCKHDIPRALQFYRLKFRFSSSDSE